MIITPHDPTRAERAQASRDKAQQLIDMANDRDKITGAHLGAALGKAVAHNLDGTPTDGSAK